MSYSGRVLVYGGKGALGASLVNFFKAKNWANVVVSETSSWTAQDAEIQGKVHEVLQDEKLDAILCVAGGWAGGNSASKDLIKNADLMCKQSVWSSVIAASLASKHLKENGLLQLTGAKPSLDGGTPGMIGYGLAKAAVHQLVKSLGDDKKGLPSGSIAVAILPVTLDTPNNRKYMANADFSAWTSLEFVCNLLYTWATGEDRPQSGSLIQMITKDNQTELIPV